MIYTHDEAAAIVEMFEDLLDKHNIRIPSPEDGQREEDNEAKLYGSVYSDLLDSVENHLIKVLDKCGESTVIVTGVFSGER